MLHGYVRSIEISVNHHAGFDVSLGKRPSGHSIDGLVGVLLEVCRATASRADI